MNRFKILVNLDIPSPEIAIFFAKHGHEAVEVKKQDMYSHLKSNTFDLCIIDTVGGSQAISIDDIRSFDVEMPILIISTNSLNSTQIVETFNKGVDDIILRPFNIAEVLCRANAILRRTRANSHNRREEYEIGSFVFIPRKSILSRGDTFVKLTYKERKILELLCSYNGDTVQKKHVLKAIWGDDTYFNARSLDVYITRIRGYFQEDPSVKIVNNRGVGYRMYVE